VRAIFNTSVWLQAGQYLAIAAQIPAKQKSGCRPLLPTTKNEPAGRNPPLPKDDTSPASRTSKGLGSEMRRRARARRTAHDGEVEAFPTAAGSSSSHLLPASHLVQLAVPGHFFGAGAGERGPAPLAPCFYFLAQAGRGLETPDADALPLARSIR
jgi:hypothetical protein